ncbi:MAG: hypothetical protein ACI3XL_06355 [Eubacteriales bacterium]
MCCTLRGNQLSGCIDARPLQLFEAEADIVKLLNGHLKNHLVCGPTAVLPSLPAFANKLRCSLRILAPSETAYFAQTAPLSRVRA